MHLPRSVDPIVQRGYRLVWYSDAALPVAFDRSEAINTSSIKHVYRVVKQLTKKLFRTVNCG